MRIVLFCHSLLSDYNHGNAHFLRGIASELSARGHEVRAFEPRTAWSVENLVADRGAAALDDVKEAYPAIDPIRFDPERLDLREALAGAHLVLVHEWTSPELVARIGEHRAREGRYRLFFHDTHHRAVTEPEAINRLDLSHYDGVLAFGRSLREVYLGRGLCRHVFVWHEAADPRVFYPRPARPERDLVWIGNYGEGERAEELERFLIGPVRALGLSARVHGARWPEAALASLTSAGIEYAGTLPNHLVPEAFSRARVTVHVPRRPYAEALPGIPTIRPFEAMASGIPLVSGPWDDRERLFTPGRDYLVARDGDEMVRHLRWLLADPVAARAMADRGRRTVLGRHTTGHRVDELLAICASLDPPTWRGREVPS